MPRIAIAGAGLAGFTVARTLRTEGYDGELVVVGAERHRPYDRPPLSKAYLSGQLDVTGLALEMIGEELDIHWRLGTAAVGLDVEHRALALADGGTVHADEIVIATGCTPRALPEQPDAPSGPAVHRIGTIEHADALRAALAPGANVVVAGAGFVGLEVAATAVALGAESVTVVCADQAPLHRFGAQASAAVRGLHERQGVRFITGARVEAVRRRSDGEPTGVVLADGRVIEASVVVAGVGSEPSTEWLVASGLALTRRGAVACDDRGRAARGIHAAGDCADWAGAPCAHWTLAQEQAELVARDILAPGAVEPDGTPAYVWSDQHSARLQFAGRLRGDETVSIEAGEIETGNPFLVYRDADGDEVAALGIDQSRLMMRWRKTHRAHPIRSQSDTAA